MLYLLSYISDADYKWVKPPTTPSKASIKASKPRSLSTSDKPIHRIFIRRAVSQEEVSTEEFAKPVNPESTGGNKKYYIRMRRHSMNDGILSDSKDQKMNPYFTKNYSKSPHKMRGEYSKSSGSPKRNLSATSLDMDQNSMLKSPPKRNKNLPTEADIFDFKAEPSGLQLKLESGEDFSNEDIHKTGTYSYSLLKGASKTSSVNPCFSSRKMFVKKINSIPTKCVSRLKQEYCSKRGTKTAPPCRKIAADTTATAVSPEERAGRQFYQANSGIHYRSIGHCADMQRWRMMTNHVPTSGVKITNPGTNSGVKMANGTGVNNVHLPARSTRIKQTDDSTLVQNVKLKDEANDGPESPSHSAAATNITMTTSSSLDSLKSNSSGTSSTDGRKMELVLNDSVLLSHAIAGS